jgi:hypothetical protein
MQGHADWDGISKERGERSRTGSYREVIYRIMQAWIEAVRREEKDHAGYHAGWDRSSEGKGERSCRGSCRLGWEQ